MPRRSTTFKLAGFAFALLALLMSGTANAVDIFAPPPTDWLMLNVMPLLGGGGANATSSPFSDLFAIMNEALLSLGGLIAGYVIIAGTVSTAHDGEMLGKNWSSMWMPIRSTVGLAFILPVKGGFCTIQLIVVWLATQGIGLGDSIWSTYLTDWSQQTATYSSPAEDTRLQSLFRSLVLSDTCFESVRGRYADETADDQATTTWLNRGDVPSSVGATWFSNLDANGAGTVGYNFGQVGDASAYAACGRATMAVKGKPASATSSTGTPTSAVTTPQTAALVLDVSTNVGPAVTAAHIAAFQAMQVAADNLAKQLVAAGQGGFVSPATINASANAAVTAYESTVNNAANSAFSAAMGGGGLANALAADGFAVAGAEYTALSRAKADTNAAVSNIPAGVDGMTAGTQHFLNLWETSTDADVGRAKALLDAADAQSTTVSGGSGADSKDNFAKIVNLFAGQGYSTVSDTQQDPMMRAYDIGQGLLNAVAHAGTAAMGLTALAAIPYLGNAVTAAAGLFGGLFTTITLTLMVPGIVLCFVLPMMPMLVVAGATFGWLVMLFESMVAAPLWMVTFLSPGHGTDGIGSQKQGMMMLLSLTLRPALLVLGTVASYVLMQRLGLFINTFFAMAFGATSGGGGFFELMRMLAGAVLYTAAMVMVVRWSLKLVTSVPDKVLDWLGGGHGAVLGGHAEAMHGGVSAIAATGAGAAAGLAGAAMKGLESGAGSINKGLQKGRDNDRTGGGGMPHDRTSSITDPNKRTPESNGTGSDAATSDGPGTVSAARAATSPAGATASAAGETPDAAASSDASGGSKGTAAGEAAGKAGGAANAAAGGASPAASRDRLVEPKGGEAAGKASGAGEESGSLSAMRKAAEGLAEGLKGKLDDASNV